MVKEDSVVQMFLGLCCELHCHWLGAGGIEALAIHDTAELQYGTYGRFL